MSPAHSSQVFNVAVIGYGMSAKVFHIPLIQHVQQTSGGLALYAILQRSPKPGADDCREDHAGVAHYRDVPTLLADAAVDVVVVTTTPETHYEFAGAALDAGKHVICEKPFAPTSKECNELVEKAQRAGKILTVYQNRRWDLDFLTLRSLLPSSNPASPLGTRIVDFETHFDRYRPSAPTNWKAEAKPGNGVIYDLGTHLLDQVVALFGQPQRVTGFVYSQRVGADAAAAGVEDSCTVICHYDGDGDGGAGGGAPMKATVRASVVSPETEQLRFWVRGDRGSFRKYGVDTQEDALKAGSRPADRGFGTEPEAQFGLLTSTDDNGKLQRRIFPSVAPTTYVAFYEGMLAALRGQGKPPVDPAEAAQVIRLIELVLQSSAEGRTLDV